MNAEDVIVLCPKGHRCPTITLSLEVHVARLYVLVRCPRCPTYRGKFVHAKFVPRLAACAAEGRPYRLSA